jgi:hypothetical protein
VSTECGAQLCILATRGDDRLDGLRAGEALSAVLLSATRLGLATTPLSQGIEASATRQKIRCDLIRATQHPQLVIRVGWPAIGATELPTTSRRPLGFVLMNH